MCVSFFSGLNAIQQYLYYTDPFVYTDGCVASLIDSQYILRYLLLLPFSFVFISTIVMSVMLCKASCNKGKPGAIGKILPYIVANAAYILWFVIDRVDILMFIDYTPYYFHWYSSIFCLKEIAIILSWLFGDPTVRKPYQALCCPCIKMDKNEEKIILLKK